MFKIDNYEKDILVIGYKNKENQTEYKWNELKFINIQYLLCTNHCLPLSHMAKSYILLEEKINVLMTSLLYI